MVTVLQLVGFGVQRPRLDLIRVLGCDLSRMIEPFLSPMIGRDRRRELREKSKYWGYRVQNGFGLLC